MSEWALCNTGQWAVVSILSLYLVVTLRLPGGVAAALLLFATCSFRMARLLVAPVLERLPQRSAILLALALAAAAYTGLGVLPPGPVALVPALLLAGAGYGANALLVKSVAAGRRRGRLVRYAALSTGLNAGAAVGPIIGTTLFLRVLPRSTFLVAGACFAGALLLAARLPAGRAAGTAASESWIGSIGGCLAIPGVRRALVYNGLTFLLYSQLFAVFPLAVTGMLRTPGLLGLYFALNAVVVVAAQIPVSRTVAALPVPPAALVGAGYACYSLGFLLLFLAPSWQVAFASIVLWSLGEVLALPATDATMAGGAPAHLRIAAFSLASIAAALGDGAGTFTGVAAAAHLVSRHHLQEWYGVLSACAAAAVAIVALVGRGRDVTVGGAMRRGGARVTESGPH